MPPVLDITVNFFAIPIKSARRITYVFSLSELCHLELVGRIVQSKGFRGKDLSYQSK